MLCSFFFFLFQYTHFLRMNAVRHFMLNMFPGLQHKADVLALIRLTYAQFTICSETI
jgi:hypothetical protein